MSCAPLLFLPFPLPPDFIGIILFTFGASAVKLKVVTLPNIGKV